MIEILESLGVSTIRVSTIYLIAAIGSNMAEKSGILNLTIEGNMLVSAFFAVIISHFTKSAFLGVAGAVVIGMLFSFLYSFTVITAKADQMISSLAFNMFGSSITAYLLIHFFKSGGATPRVNSVHTYPIPILSNIPVLGNVFFNQSPIVYLSFIMVGVMYFVLYYSRFGLRVTAVGENPIAASTVGINVRKTRYQAMLIAGAITGLAGAYLSISLSSQFVKNMTAGRGYIALSAIIVGKHKPVNIAFAALLFGFCEALQIRLQLFDFPNQFIQMIPYVVTIIVISFFVGKDDNPAAIGQPF